MRISTKGRYGLAVMVKLGEDPTQWVPISKLSQELGLSKLYLEQVLSLLKNGNLVQSTKGPQGGYRISSVQTTVYDLLSVLEPSLFEHETSVGSNTDLEHMLTDHVFMPMQNSLDQTLKSITLESLVETSRHKREAMMFYI